MNSEAPTNFDQENAQFPTGSLQPDGDGDRTIRPPEEDVATGEKLLEPSTDSNCLQYYKRQTDKFPREPPVWEGQSMPAPQPARDPKADDAFDERSDENQGNSVNIIASEVPQSNARHPEVDLVVKALDILGSPKQLGRWMKTSLPALRGQTPYSLMQSEEGRKQVETVLAQIEHGIY